MTPRTSRIGLIAAAGVVVVVQLGLAVHQVWRPDGYPTWDASSYLMEAVRLRKVLVSGDAARIVQAVTKPDLHPPGHALLLAGWMTVFGTAMTAARAYAFAGFLAALTMLLALGRALHPERSVVVGAVAAALTACGAGNLTLLLSPMTEATAIAAQLLALLVAVVWIDRPAWRGHLAIGTAALAAGLVRYNLLPMLLAPFAAYWVLRHLRTPRRWVDARPIVWGVPALLTFGAWQLHRPELKANIQKFLENRSSGLEFWSVENLGWVPIQVSREYLASPLLVGALFVFFLLGLLPRAWQRWREPGEEEWGLRVLQLYVLVSFALLTWHDFKITRNLASVLPVFYVCALHPFLVAVRWRATIAPAVFAVGAVVYLPWRWTGDLRTLAEHSDFRPDPAVRGALDLVAKNAKDQPTVWIVGWVFRLPPDLLLYRLDAEGYTGKIKLDQPLHGTQTRTGVDAAWNEAYPTEVETMLKAAPDATFITIETTPGTRFYDDWKAFGNNYARAIAARPELTEIDRVQFVDEGLLVRAWRRGGTPSTAGGPADKLPRPEDDATVRPLPATPLWRETFAAPAPLWRVFPPWALKDVEIERQASSLRVRLPTTQKNLQICSELIDRPADGAVAVVHLRTEALEGAKTWLHVRGMDAAGKLQERDGKPDISMTGPLLPNGEGRHIFDVGFGPQSPKMRLCAVLDGTAGVLVLDDWALYPAGTKDTPAAAAAVVKDGADPPWMETFDSPSGWSFTPLDTSATATWEAGSLKVDVPSAAPKLQVCGKPFAWQGTPSGAITVQTHLVGKGWVHFRALDAEGKLVQREGGAAIAQAGPLTGDERKTWTLTLDFPPQTTQVRPCIVLDGATGSVALEDAAVGR